MPDDNTFILRMKSHGTECTIWANGHGGHIYKWRSGKGKFNSYKYESYLIFLAS